MWWCGVPAHGVGRPSARPLRWAVTQQRGYGARRGNSAHDASAAPGSCQDARAVHARHAPSWIHFRQVVRSSNTACEKRADLKLLRDLACVRW
jgi:hypothetical protein